MLLQWKICDCIQKNYNINNNNHNNNNKSFNNLCVLIYEFESIGGLAWNLESFISLEDIILPKLDIAINLSKKLININVNQTSYVFF